MLHGFSAAPPHLSFPMTLQDVSAEESQIPVSR